MASITKNFFYNSILTTANYVFPFLTFPYVSRVLGVTNIGICNYVDSIIQNYMLFSMMGIGIVGIREIVAAKHDRILLNRTFSSLFYLNALMTAATIAVLIVCIHTIPEFSQYKAMMYVGVFKLLANSLMIEWFFKGLEDFQYITVRSIIVRLVYVLAVFLLIREHDDYEMYFVLTAMMFVLNAIVNCLYARKFTALTTHPLPLGRFMRPIMILGIYSILTSMYGTFNTIWLGIEAGATEVGYFTTALKIYTILLALFSVFTTVMLPRMGNILKDGDKEKFNEMLFKSMRALYAFVIPLACFGVIYAADIVLFIAGPGYEGAVLPMQLCMPLMLLVGYEQIIIIQGLMPLEKDRAILVNSICGAVTAVVLCIFLLEPLKAVGASLVWIGSEIAVTISASIFVKKYIGISFPFADISRYVLYNAPLVGILFLLERTGIVGNSVWPTLGVLTIGGCITALYSFILQYFILKEELIINLFDKFRHHHRG